MKLCFVARDEEEFVRYLKGQPPIFGMEPLYPNILKDRQTRKVLRRCGIYKEQKYESSFEWFSFCAVTDPACDLQVYVMLSKLDDKKCKSYIRDNFTVLDTDEVRPKVIKFLEAIECCMQQDCGCGNISFDNETFVFIHWGGGDPSWYEEKFQSFCDGHSDSAKGLRAFALSSRRRELFNVSADEIHLPTSKTEAIDLIDCFSFARIKDTMTEYVLRYFEVVNAGQSDGEKLPLFEANDKRILSPMYVFLDSQIKRLESRSRAYDIDKRRFHAAEMVLGRVKKYIQLDNENKQKESNENPATPLTLPYDEDVVEIFTAWIRGGSYV